MRIAEIVGARPQFIKVATVSRELKKKDTDIIIHTGQHYDDNMSKIFFDELDIPKPDYNLGVGSGTHGKQTGEMIASIETVLMKEKPEMVLVYGDTNSTLAGALAAVKLHIPTAHVEAGLRSYNKTMPEEINRVIADHISDVLFAPTETAVSNLKTEGKTEGVHLTGDCMFDALIHNQKLAKNKDILDTFGLKPNGYILATVHRPSNTDVRTNLSSIMGAFRDSPIPIVFPVHPRTLKYMKDFGIDTKGVHIVDPQGYLEFLTLETHANGIVTDSGGIQKEAYLLKKRCITLRDETEWVETVKDGWNVLVGPDRKKILKAITGFHPKGKQKNYYGDGKAAKKIVSILRSYL
jgi:UDP-GlcNAc3NAcA epimerase